MLLFHMFVLICSTSYISLLVYWYTNVNGVTSESFLFALLQTYSNSSPTFLWTCNWSKGAVFARFLWTQNILHLTCQKARAPHHSIFQALQAPDKKWLVWDGGRGQDFQGLFVHIGACKTHAQMSIGSWCLIMKKKQKTHNIFGEFWSTLELKMLIHKMGEGWQVW